MVLWDEQNIVCAGCSVFGLQQPLLWRSCYNNKNFKQIHWKKLFFEIYGLVVMQTIPRRATSSKNIDTIFFHQKCLVSIQCWLGKLECCGTLCTHSTVNNLHNIYLPQHSVQGKMLWSICLINKQFKRELFKIEMTNDASWGSRDDKSSKTRTAESFCKSYLTFQW